MNADTGRQRQRQRQRQQRAMGDVPTVAGIETVVRQ